MKYVDKINICNGMLVLEKGISMRNYRCPFSAKGVFCGDWCIHFGGVRPGMGGFDLELTCGSGLHIHAKTYELEAENTNHDD